MNNPVRSRSLALLVVLLAAGPALAQKVFIDYDENYDVSGIETYAWKSTPETSYAGPAHSLVMNSIEFNLSLGGMTKVTEEPDIYITYHAETEDHMTLNTATVGYGYPHGWVHSGYYGYHGSFYGASTTSVNKYQTGTLVVDAWNPKTNEIVWRGIADDIHIVANRAGMQRQVDKAIEKIVKKSRKLRAKDAKKRK
ncbi:MAG: DUF4136 domain-containing protein [bacterium]|nr:DUF4136 domain-containing protein [bacterium]